MDEMVFERDVLALARRERPFLQRRYVNFAR